MSTEIIGDKQNRKRVRQSDPNQSIPQVLPKVRRKNLENNMPNPTPSTGGQFIDLSRTINQTPTQRQEEMVAERRAPTVGDTNVAEKSLENKVKEIVQSEMVEMRKNIERLTKCVADLARLTPPANNAVVTTQGQNNLNGGSNSSQTVNGNSDGATSRDGSSISTNFRLLPIQNENFSLQQQQHFEATRIRVDKLGVTFDGVPSHSNIDDFVFRLEHVQKQYQIPWAEILRDFHLLMIGSAKEWYWLYIKTHGIVDWPGLKHALVTQYQVTRSNFEIMRDLVERKQQHGESVDNYFHAMCQIRSRLIQPIPEYDLIKIIKRNIRESIGRIVYPIAVSSVEQLRVECNEAERNFPRREIRPVQPMMKQNKYVSEIYYDENHEDENMEAVQQAGNYEDVNAVHVNVQQRKQTLVCLNCKQPGHVYMDCTSMERNLFCYKCGRPNVITPRCPSCQSGNQYRSLTSKGDPSSSGNQTPRAE